ncbi:hypothetical protein BJ742DRAFT_766608 [Cladochytrium replicatum]|nr:hypothetical protein BJ742DRAFT_766608 [Cladochytrium replicatum]
MLIVSQKMKIATRVQKPPAPPKLLTQFSEFLIARSSPRGVVGSLLIYFVALLLMAQLESKLHSTLGDRGRGPFPDYMRKYDGPTLLATFELYGGATPGSSSSRACSFCMAVRGVGSMVQAHQSSSARVVALAGEVKNVALLSVLSGFEDVTKYCGSLTTWKESISRFCGSLGVMTVVVNFGQDFMKGVYARINVLRGKEPRVNGQAC